MLAKRIIPCLDVRNGRVVKGINFQNIRDAGDPVEQAALYAKEGADEIVYLDITASLEKRRAILGIVEKTSQEAFIPLTVGGGLRNIDDIRLLLKSGADKVSLNTAAVENPSLIKEASYEFGSQCIVLAIDAKLVHSPQPRVHKKEQRNLSTPKWEVYTYGGRKPTGIDALKWAKKAQELGAGEILLTSMDRDGTKEGYDLELTRRVSEIVSIPVIASGGVGKLEHLYEGLTKGKADAVLAASIFHHGEYPIKAVKEYLKERGLPIRM